MTNSKASFLKGEEGVDEGRAVRAVRLRNHEQERPPRSHGVHARTQALPGEFFRG